MPASPSATESISVVIPVLNEAGSIGSLLREVCEALRGSARFEIIVVDDGSDDGSATMVQAAMTRAPEVRLLRHERRCGQSAAIRSGVEAARSPWVATLDGDGQNDPADIPRLLARRAQLPSTVRLLAGWRIERRDTWSKRFASLLANRIRAGLLRDETPDTGCGIKLFDRAVFLDLPYFDHMHRYLPALFRRAGWRCESIPVNHRERRQGTSKYGNLQRALVGLRDLLGVAWLIARSHRAPVVEISPP
ncbi:glycosyltransferase family 2 protein [Pseudomarimonas salicorniae]|uniref:Glycosyltransferase family 2 protein n=1 Tax=Pseudomarimonas salicorniae TaxID=2933270 RepID=A0ABT0GDS4_9GAMM|nr:glycosyltransferase family 2 protein [Lysobacter sp. CAU 1642]MCK7592704.1 glycosyltransferase family 2 protein [Lysobacter sp. CAU 1642]